MTSEKRSRSPSNDTNEAYGGQGIDDNKRTCNRPEMIQFDSINDSNQKSSVVDRDLDSKFEQPSEDTPQANDEAAEESKQEDPRRNSTGGTTLAPNTTSTQSTGTLNATSAFHAIGAPIQQQNAASVAHPQAQRSPKLVGDGVFALQGARAQGNPAMVQPVATSNDIISQIKRLLGEPHKSEDHLSAQKLVRLTLKMLQDAKDNKGASRARLGVQLDRLCAFVDISSCKDSTAKMKRLLKEPTTCPEHEDALEDVLASKQALMEANQQENMCLNQLHVELNHLSRFSVSAAQPPNNATASNYQQQHTSWNRSYYSNAPRPPAMSGQYHGTHQHWYHTSSNYYNQYPQQQQVPHHHPSNSSSATATVTAAPTTRAQPSISGTANGNVGGAYYGYYQMPPNTSRQEAATGSSYSPTPFYAGQSSSAFHPPYAVSAQGGTSPRLQERSVNVPRDDRVARGKSSVSTNFSPSQVSAQAEV